MSKHEILPESLGEEFGSGLRATSRYEDTERIFHEQGLTEEVLNQTPPVGVNLQILSGMKIMNTLRTKFSLRPIRATILGLAIAEGVPDFQRFLRTALNTDWNELKVVDFDSEILDTVEDVVKKLGLSSVKTLHRDARNTGIEHESQNIVLRDHIGNCCPPAVDRTMDCETARILKPGCIAIVNITTSELLLESPSREMVTFEQLNSMVTEEVLQALQTEIYDLAQLKTMFGEQFEKFRGLLLEIERNSSFVVFGEDPDGHGEWFRLFEDHLSLWEQDGFEILERQEREGNDSHTPPLRCRRHNVVLRKK